jgi:SAM-dependent methyltransferase
VSSEELTRSFYAQLGAAGLAGRTRAEWDEQIVAALVELLPPRARVLDVGCGYGRVALPLARAGYDVEGIDLSPNLVDAARAAAAAEHLPVRFRVGSMTALPYKDGSFDVALCLWSAFHELLEEDEQVRTLREVWRVLSRGGFALFEGPLYEEPTEEEIASGARRGPDHRIAWLHINGILNPHYQHDAASYAHLCRAAGIESFEVFERDWSARRRLFLRLEKESGSAN